MRDIPFIPRFYIDHLVWLRHSGYEIESQTYDSMQNPRFDEELRVRLLNYNPSDNIILDYATTANETAIAQNSVGFTMTSGYENWDDTVGKWFIASLGNNHFGSGTKWDVKFTDDLDATNGTVMAGTEVINGFTNGFDGFNIETFDINSGGDDLNVPYLNFDLNSRNSDELTDIGIGALSFGKVYDMPVNSDVELNMSYEYGTSSKETKYGSSITNIEWTAKPDWNGRPAWELYTDTDLDNAYKVNKDLAWRKSGRRVYEMSFSFLSSDDMLATSGVTGNSSTMEENLFTGDTTAPLTDNGTNVVDNNINIKNDSSFYAQVVHKTMGFSLPFIFQPDKNYAKPDGFMFAKVDADEFNLEQLAPDLWRCKMKIREIW
jgi:hypothetical protein